MISKKRYRLLCKDEQIHPIFIQDWWLDAVCGEENWNVAVFEKDHKIIAALSYYLKKRGLYRGIQLPPFTPHLGPFLRYPERQTSSERLSFEKQALTQLIEQLPSVDYFTLSFSPLLTNWLPFYWKGYSQTTKYTYILENINDIDGLVLGFSYAKQKNLKRAKNLLQVNYGLSYEDFYRHHKKSLAKMGEKINYSADLLKRIFKAATDHQSGTSLYTFDQTGNIHSALFLVWDCHTTYNLISTIDPDFRSSGSVALLIREGLQFAASKSRQFDFEGSMIEGVENSFRQFGAQQTPYFKVMKYPSLLARMAKALQRNP